MRQQRREQLVGLRTMIGSRRFEQRDGFGDCAALRGTRLFNNGLRRNWGLSPISLIVICLR
jgi:hypothetical protein